MASFLQVSSLLSRSASSEPQIVSRQHSLRSWSQACDTPNGSVLSLQTMVRGAKGVQMSPRGASSLPELLVSQAPSSTPSLGGSSRSVGSHLSQQIGSRPIALGGTCTGFVLFSQRRQLFLCPWVSSTPARSPSSTSPRMKSPSIQRPCGLRHPLSSHNPSDSRWFKRVQIPAWTGP